MFNVCNRNHSHAKPPWHPINASFVGWCMHFADLISTKANAITMLEKELHENTQVVVSLQTVEEGTKLAKPFAKEVRLIRHLIGRISNLP